MNDDVDIRCHNHPRLATVKTTVQFNWDALGEHFMRANSEQQAEFLLGWLREAQHIGDYATGHQYLYIDQAVAGDSTRKAVADQLRSLADYLEAEVDR